MPHKLSLCSPVCRQPTAQVVPSLCGPVFRHTPQKPQVVPCMSATYSLEAQKSLTFGALYVGNLQP